MNVKYIVGGIVALCLTAAGILSMPRFTQSSAQVNSRQSDCSSHHPGGVVPVNLRSGLERNTDLLCFEAYALHHSGVTRTAIWSAERLDGNVLRNAPKLEREDVFHVESRISPQNRAELADYVRSGFDRGHLAPNGNMTTRNAKDESFSLANMIPQRPENNRGIWSQIESATRNMAMREGVIYSVTGPLYIGDRMLAPLNGRVAIPTHIFKALYNPRTNQAGVYISENSTQRNFNRISLNELERIGGIRVFPNITGDVRSQVMNMDEPLERRR